MRETLGDAFRHFADIDFFLAGLESGEMNFGNRGFRHSSQVHVGVEAVIHGVHVDVVDVEQDSTVRAPRHFGKELPFRHCRGAERDVAGDVLEEDLPSERVLVEYYLTLDNLVQQSLAEEASDFAEQGRQRSWREAVAAVQHRIERVGMPNEE